MEVKRNYLNGRPDTLIRDGRALGIWIPNEKIWAGGDHYIKPVHFTDAKYAQNEDGRIDILGPGTATSTWLITNSVVMEAAVLEGQAHFVGVSLGKNQTRFQLEDYVVNAAENGTEILFKKDLLFTWVGDTENTTILTTSRPGFRTNPALPVEFGIQQLRYPQRKIPSGYWDFLKNLQQFIRQKDTKPGIGSNYPISLNPRHSNLFTPD
jgi:hypothetical protein